MRCNVERAMCKMSVSTATDRARILGKSEACVITVSLFFTCSFSGRHVIKAVTNQCGPVQYPLDTTGNQEQIIVVLLFHCYSLTEL
ncbi:hypothetical protein KIN20_014218 [Parelaphostrongylus tenuis]|uniref:Uncharacterized protein n=1 Tax=Parelaphostrongylus tenuis TaxID=148309 RepID=A0AAD5QP88_PARTN|nr:hypothetical protein KIN20_014218 [Parelaphostrongylus tenuis]